MGIVPTFSIKVCWVWHGCGPGGTGYMVITHTLHDRMVPHSLSLHMSKSRTLSLDPLVCMLSFRDCTHTHSFGLWWADASTLIKYCLLSTSNPWPAKKNKAYTPSPRRLRKYAIAWSISSLVRLIKLTHCKRQRRLKTHTQHISANKQPPHSTSLLTNSHHTAGSTSLTQ